MAFQDQAHVDRNRDDLDKAHKMKTKFKKPSKEVSERMKRVRGRGTKIEGETKKLLDELNLKYEEQPKIKCVQGTPDFRIKGTRILIFCDSSFLARKEKKRSHRRGFQ